MFFLQDTPPPTSSYISAALVSILQGNKHGERWFNCLNDQNPPIYGRQPWNIGIPSCCETNYTTHSMKQQGKFILSIGGLLSNSGFKTGQLWWYLLILRLSSRMQSSQMKTVWVGIPALKHIVILVVTVAGWGGVVGLNCLKICFLVGRSKLCVDHQRTIWATQNAPHFPLYWLVNRDPSKHNGFIIIPI